MVPKTLVYANMTLCLRPISDLRGLSRINEDDQSAVIAAKGATTPKHMNIGYHYCEEAIFLEG